MARACIGIGSNLGDRAAHIAMARQALGGLPATRLVAFSSIHETDPVGPPGQDKYLNAAAVLDTELDPFELLGHLRDIEKRAGRQRREKWAARTLDLDLLLYDEQVIEAPDLKVPHPHMHGRRFVLEPLVEIAPQAVHPQRRKTVASLLGDLQ